MNKLYRVKVQNLEKQVRELQTSQEEIHTQFLNVYDLVEKNKAQYEQEKDTLVQGMKETENYLVDHLDQAGAKLEGMVIYSE